MKSKVIGLTGPASSGKDTLAKMFKRRGAAVIDADRIGHNVLAPQTKAWHEIVKLFGSKVLNRGGKVNRRKLGRIVFSDRSMLRKLDKISHPAMAKIIKQAVINARKKNKRLIVINAAVLEQMMLLPVVDKVILILASRKKRINRMVKAGLSRREALDRIWSQYSDKRYRKTADIVIVNNGEPDQLKTKFKRIYESL